VVDPLDVQPVSGTVVVAENNVGKFSQSILVNGRHTLFADEPQSVGGDDSGPSPYDLLLAGLGACTSMTLRMYAEHKGIALDKVSVSLKHAKVHAEDCQACETDADHAKLDSIEREIEIIGDLDEKTRQRLLEIADKCPVHRTLHSEIRIDSRLKP
ncbi:MAG: OsmC family protein, partial [Alphaproteobacteria bacterium]